MIVNRSSENDPEAIRIGSTQTQIINNTTECPFCERKSMPGMGVCNHCFTDYNIEIKMGWKPGKE